MREEDLRREHGGKTGVVGPREHRPQYEVLEEEKRPEPGTGKNRRRRKNREKRVFQCHPDDYEPLHLGPSQPRVEPLRLLPRDEVQRAAVASLTSGGPCSSRQADLRDERERRRDRSAGSEEEEGGSSPATRSWRPLERARQADTAAATEVATGVQARIDRAREERRASTTTQPREGPRRRNRGLKRFRVRGTAFGGIERLAMDPALDPPDYSCFSCWRPMHERRGCPNPGGWSFCFNCGRRDVDVTRCPRCAEAYRRWMGARQWMPRPTSPPRTGRSRSRSPLQRDAARICGMAARDGQDPEMVRFLLTRKRRERSVNTAEERTAPPPQGDAPPRMRPVEVVRARNQGAGGQHSPTPAAPTPPAPVARVRQASEVSSVTGERRARGWHELVRSLAHLPAEVQAAVLLAAVSQDATVDEDQDGPP